MSRPGARRDQPVVPDADFRSYYDQPVIKPPTWDPTDVPAYLYLGGLAGAAAPMAALADATGRRRLRRVGRVGAAVGATVSVAALIHDLGRPGRFLHMLRVFKPTSPLSVGSWILAPFGTLSGAAAVGELSGLAPRPARAAGAVSGLLGPAMTTYTAVLLADTAVPAWHEAFRYLPVVFAASALSSAGGLGMLAAGDEAEPARRMALAGSGVELAAAAAMQRRIGLPGEAYRTGRAGTLLRAARALTGGGAVGALLARRERTVRRAAGLALNAGAALTRLGVFHAGMASARDPRHTVIPQRERLGQGARPSNTLP